MKINEGVPTAIPLKQLKISSMGATDKETDCIKQELSLLQEDVRSLRQDVLQLLQLRGYYSKAYSGEDSATAGNLVLNSPHNDKTESQNRVRVAKILKKHFAMMDIAAGINEYDWFNFNLGMMSAFNSDNREGQEFILPPHILDGIQNDIIRVDDDPNSETNPNYKGYRTVMGVWSWGRRNKYLNYLMNGMRDKNDETWRTLDKQDYTLTGALSIGDPGSKFGSL